MTIRCLSMSRGEAVRQTGRMGRALTAVVLMACATGTARAQGGDATSVILALEQRLAQAWVDRDRRFIEQLLAADWTVTDASGRILRKQQVIDETFASTERRIDAMTVDDVVVRDLGGVAVATGRTRASGSYRGTRASVELRFTDVFVRRDGRWQVVTSHATTVVP
jgi:ketosteroid isomerase-like protein